MRTLMVIPSTLFMFFNNNVFSMSSGDYPLWICHWMKVYDMAVWTVEWRSWFISVISSSYTV